MTVLFSLMAFANTLLDSTKVSVGCRPSGEPFPISAWRRFRRTSPDLTRSACRLAQDTLVITAVNGGVEQIPFLLVYVVFPSSVLFLLLFSYISTHFSRRAPTGERSSRFPPVGGGRASGGCDLTWLSRTARSVAHACDRLKRMQPARTLRGLRDMLGSRSSLRSCS